jgi:hypothetical protein
MTSFIVTIVGRFGVGASFCSVQSEKNARHRSRPRFHQV